MNTVALVGRLGRDPELRETQGGTKVCSFSIATNRYKKDDPPDWHNCTAFGKTAEHINEYFHKGKQIAITGRIQNDVVKKDGKTTTYSKIIVDGFTFIDDGKRDQDPGQPSNGNRNDEEDMPF